ncbi:DUF397 domain-containing protein [Streptomyces sp. NRRL F-5527]|uniref:DUF397 domain-containing protein n=1 Tax=Streptomyces TaxID=1883 RepID=UPI00099B8CDE|nr:DUF397 domain-containing protein [Streptomyces sp. NRRL F-5527]
MPRVTTWRESPYSGPDDGNNCVEVATSADHTAVRDSKASSQGVLVFHEGVFAEFVDALKGAEGRPCPRSPETGTSAH